MYVYVDDSNSLTVGDMLRRLRHESVRQRTPGENGLSCAGKGTLTKVFLSALCKSSMYKLYFDGGCGPQNPGGRATYGSVLYKDNQRIWKAQGVIDEINTSNNVAEYGGLIIGLSHLLSIGAQNEQIVVFGDSKLVIAQMFRQWKIKKGIYLPYANHCHTLLKEFTDIKGKLLPRHLNTEADALTHFFSTEKVKILPDETTLFG